MVAAGFSAASAQAALEREGIGTGVLFTIMLVGAVISVAIYAVGGAVCGAIGAFVGQKK